MPNLTECKRCGALAAIVEPARPDFWNVPLGVCAPCQQREHEHLGGTLGAMAQTCRDCGQAFVSSIPQDTCGAFKCREREAQDRQPQGEAIRLFEPAPNQIPGQLSIERPRLVRERDECACGACGAVIPNTLDGTLYNRFHAPHCEFHAG